MDKNVGYMEFKRKFKNNVLWGRNFLMDGRMIYYTKSY